MGNLPAPFDKDMVYIKTPDKIHNTYGICFFLTEANFEKIINFRLVTVNALINYENVNNFKFNFFVQGQESNWLYIELWNGKDHQNDILYLTEILSEHFRLPLDIV